MTVENISKYYDQSHTHYVQHWGLNRYQALHYGLWWPETQKFGEALLNTQRFMAKVADIQVNEKVLDAGCGVGGSSIWLAKEKDCQVLGISLSEKQIGHAHGFSDKAGQREKTSFEVRDFTDTGLQAASFDVVWAIESVCHANAKIDFLQEAYRVLKPGGRLILCDFFQAKKEMTPAQQQLLHAWLDGWAVPELDILGDFVQSTREAGFQDLHSRNLTREILPSARRLNRRFMLGFPIQKLYEWLANPTPAQRKSVRTARWQWQALQQELWQYALVFARKPR